MKIFVINLDKEKARMASIDAQLLQLGIDYERISAVYGKELTKDELKYSFSAFRSFCAMGIRLTSGEIGCALSHLSVYRQMIEEGIPYALVFEDDIIIDDSFNARIQEVEDFIREEKKQVILLSALGFRAKEKGIFKNLKGTCADGYVITLPAAREIYKSNCPVVVVADKWQRWAKWFGVEIYTCWPPIVRQDNEQFGTDVDSWVVPRQNSTGNGTGKVGIALILFRGCRVVEKVFDWLFWKLTGR